VRALGIDVGVGKGLDLVLIDEGRVPFVVMPRAGLDDVERLVREGKPSIVAIDGPPRWARDGRSRATENELARLNVHAFRTPSEAHATSRTFDWMRRGMEVFACVDGLGFPLATSRPWKDRAIEVFPHATAAVLAGCLAPKGLRKRAWRDRVLRLAGVRTEELTTLDLVDAALAALTGLLVLDGQASGLGDPSEGVIIIPTNAPAPSYRPGVLAPPDREGQLFAWCACGMCDQQVPAGREFARGHDAKRKSMLWRQMRDGREAQDELRRRGWERPPETS
jgi:predicted nuclease with RNAse H fold